VVKRNTAHLFLPIAIFVAFQAFLYARYLITNFFPDVTLIDLGVFYVLGFISALFVGPFLVLSRRRMAGE